MENPALRIDYMPKANISVFVRACVRERERNRGKREREAERERELSSLSSHLRESGVAAREA